MFCRPASVLPGCWVDIPLFCRRKSFPQKRGIQSVEERLFFHMLKTLWRKFKSPALKPVLPVEFHTFHKVFHFWFDLFDFLRTICRIQVGNMTIFELHPVRFCQIAQYHFDECGSVLKIRPSSSFLSFGRSLHIIWKFVAFYRIYALLAVTPCTLPETESPHCYRKNTGLD